jgi:phage baseplate assembly protein W
LVKYTNEEAVKRSIRNLISTDKYDRVFQPEVGCRVRNLLFENMSSVIEQEIKGTIQETIETYEPRAQIIDIAVQSNESRQSYDVYIYFQVINSITPISINITLYRAR